MTGAGADQWSSHGVPNSVLLSKPFAPARPGRYGSVANFLIEPQSEQASGVHNAHRGTMTPLPKCAVAADGPS